MLRIVARRLKNIIDEVLGGSSKFPPLAVAPCLAPASSSGSSSANYDISDIINDMRILLGVPKYRTSKPKKVTRKFSYTRLLSPVEDLVTCQSCGSHHQASTICGNCYSKVRELTNEIKRKMMDYNPYKGDKNNKQIFVKFGDDQLDQGVVNGKRVIEMERERPTWFKKIVQNVSTTCVILNCPTADVRSNVGCTNCSDCYVKDVKSKFCVLAVHTRNILEFLKRTPLPPPAVHPEGSGSIAVVVGRFFSQPNYVEQAPSSLYLLAHFFTPNLTHCRDFHSIQAQRRSDTECLLRVHVAMPGVDHKTDDHYYYDDGTDLETNFSTEMFEGAKEVSFWIEATLQHEETIASGKTTFSSLARSTAIRHTLQGRVTTASPAQQPAISPK